MPSAERPVKFGQHDHLKTKPSTAAQAPGALKPQAGVKSGCAASVCGLGLEPILEQYRVSLDSSFHLFRAWVAMLPKLAIDWKRESGASEARPSFSHFPHWKKYLCFK